MGVCGGTNSLNHLGGVFVVVRIVLDHLGGVCVLNHLGGYDHLGLRVGFVVVRIVLNHLGGVCGGTNSLRWYLWWYE